MRERERMRWEGRERSAGEKGETSTGGLRERAAGGEREGYLNLGAMQGLAPSRNTTTYRSWKNSGRNYWRNNRDDDGESDYRYGRHVDEC